MKEEKRYQKGQFIGLLFGAILGFIVEKAMNKNPTELTEEQKQQLKIFTWIGIVIAVLLLISIVALFMAKLGK